MAFWGYATLAGLFIIGLLIMPTAFDQGWGLWWIIAWVAFMVFTWRLEYMHGDLQPSKRNATQKNHIIIEVEYPKSR